MLDGIPIYSSSCKTTKYSSPQFSCLALVALLMVLPIPGHAASTAGCTVQATNYQGWKAQQLANRWVKLIIVPQLGGRLIQVTFGGHDFLFVDPQIKAVPPGSPTGSARIYAGDKIEPLPEGNQDEQHWGGGGLLNNAPYSLEVLSRRPRCAVRLTGPLDPSIGQQYIRDISIGPDSPSISFHAVMKNVSGFPQTWSEQSVSKYNAADPADPSQFNPKFWGMTPVNPKTEYPGGYHVRVGPQDNPAFSVSDGMFRVQWENTVSEVWIDTPFRWLAVVDGTSGYTMIERSHYDPTADYPGYATMIFYTSAQRTRPTQFAGMSAAGQNLGTVAGQNSNVTPAVNGPPIYYMFMEAEANSPMVELAPGESYAMDTQWYPTRMGSNFKTTTWAGVIGTPLTATATPAGLKLSGNFGVFYAGDLVAHLYPRPTSGKDNRVKLMSVTPTEQVQLQTTIQAPPNTSRVSVHLVDAEGLDRGPLGEVLVDPPPSQSQAQQ